MTALMDHRSAENVRTRVGATRLRLAVHIWTKQAFPLMPPEAVHAANRAAASSPGGPVPAHPTDTDVRCAHSARGAGSSHIASRHALRSKGRCCLFHNCEDCQGFGRQARDLWACGGGAGAGQCIQCQSATSMHTQPPMRNRSTPDPPLHRSMPRKTQKGGKWHHGTALDRNGEADIRYSSPDAQTNDHFLFASGVPTERTQSEAPAPDKESP